MGWYDVFSRFYDASLEELYAEARLAAAHALDLAPGQSVLDVPCGTGQSFDAVAPRVLPGGAVFGVDASAGMVRRAKERIASRGWTHVRAVEGSVHALAELRAAAGGAPEGGGYDRALVFLGLTVFPEWERAFERVWGALAPGGRCVVVDVHAAELGLRGRMVNLVAGADIRRRVWEPLERVSLGFERRDQPANPSYGGTLFVATGTKPP